MDNFRTVLPEIGLSEYLSPQAKHTCLKFFILLADLLYHIMRGAQVDGIWERAKEYEKMVGL